MMTRKEFLERLDQLKLTQKDFSLIVGCSHQTVKQWKDYKIPRWVVLALNHLKILQDNVSLANEYGIR